MFTSPLGTSSATEAKVSRVIFLLSVEQSDVPAWCDLVAVDLVHPLLIALTDAHRTARLGGRVNAVVSGNHPVGVDDGTGAHALVGVGIINADGDDRLCLLGVAGEGLALHGTSWGDGECSCCDHPGGHASCELLHFYPFQIPRRCGVAAFPAAHGHTPRATHKR